MSVLRQVLEAKSFDQRRLREHLVSEGFTVVSAKGDSLVAMRGLMALDVAFFRGGCWLTGLDSASVAGPRGPSLSFRVDAPAPITYSVVAQLAEVVERKLEEWEKIFTLVTAAVEMAGADPSEFAVRNGMWKVGSAGVFADRGGKPELVHVPTKTALMLAPTVERLASSITSTLTYLRATRKPKPEDIAESYGDAELEDIVSALAAHMADEGFGGVRTVYLPSTCAVIGDMAGTKFKVSVHRGHVVEWTLTAVREGPPIASMEFRFSNFSMVAASASFSMAKFEAWAKIIGFLERACEMVPAPRVRRQLADLSAVKHTGALVAADGGDNLYYFWVGGNVFRMSEGEITSAEAIADRVRAVRAKPPGVAESDDRAVVFAG